MTALLAALALAASPVSRAEVVAALGPPADAYEAPFPWRAGCTVLLWTVSGEPGFAPASTVRRPGEWLVSVLLDREGRVVLARASRLDVDGPVHDVTEDLRAWLARRRA